MGCNVLHTQFKQVIQSHPKPNRLYNAWCTGFELHRGIIVDHSLFRDFLDHVTTANKRTHLFHTVHFAIDRPRPGGAIELVPSDGVEIAANVLNVHRRMHGPLRAIHKHRHALGMCPLRDSLHIHHCAQHIGALRHSHQLGLGPDRINHRLGIQRPGAVHIHPFQNNALPFPQEMPRHYVGMVLHHRENDLVTCCQTWHSPAIGDHIDAFGGAGIQNNFLFAGGIQKLGDLSSHSLILVRREIRKVV
mmetsp:Transcript_23567/g.41661  ORF Transcript_23567/g.41661 Transcript_23567/m.41661 type:complete len:247 (-) Transcript_23567:1622-2362(-)